MTGTLRPNRTVHPTSKQPPMRYIRYLTDVPEASAKLVDLGTQPVILNVRTCMMSGRCAVSSSRPREGGTAS
jgi:hypothetical protein